MGTTEAKAIQESDEDDKKNDECKVKESIVIKQEIDTYILKNPYIIIIGISKYDAPTETLRAVPVDVQKMKQLWLDTFKYDRNYISIVTESIGSQYVTMQQLNKYLNKMRNKIDSGDYGKCDGVIIIYSGHGISNGLDNYILCSDNRMFSVREIQEKFSSKHCDYLANTPKILYFDCCRGGEVIRAEGIQQKKGNQLSRYINELSDFYIHFATCHNYISWGKSEEDGSHFIYALYNYYITHYKEHVMSTISLHQSSIKINQMVNISNNGKQTSEIIDRLTYDVYIQPNTEHPLSDKILSTTYLRPFYDEALIKKEEYENTIQIIKEDKDKLSVQNIEKNEIIKQLNEKTKEYQTTIQIMTEDKNKLNAQNIEKNEIIKELNGKTKEWETKCIELKHENELKQQQLNDLSDKMKEWIIDLSDRFNKLKKENEAELKEEKTKNCINYRRSTAFKYVHI